jgi:hypothetical protein
VRCGKGFERGQEGEGEGGCVGFGWIYDLLRRVGDA